MHSVGIVGILRLFFGVRRRCDVDVRFMDTDNPPGLSHQLAIALRATSPTPDSRPSERLRSHGTQMSQK